MEEVSIPVVLLEEMKQAVTSAWYFSQTFDLQDSYKLMSNKPVKTSKMTDALESSAQILDTYIELAQEEGPEDEPDSDTD